MNIAIYSTKNGNCRFKREKFQSTGNTSRTRNAPTHVSNANKTMTALPGNRLSVSTGGTGGLGRKNRRHNAYTSEKMSRTSTNHSGPGPMNASKPPPGRYLHQGRIWPNVT